jgi:hypothetical protein
LRYNLDSEGKVSDQKLLDLVKFVVKEAQLDELASKNSSGNGLDM